jgi:hypothetical protein
MALFGASQWFGSPLLPLLPPVIFHCNGIMSTEARRSTVAKARAGSLPSIAARAGARPPRSGSERVEQPGCRAGTEREHGGGVRTRGVLYGGEQPAAATASPFGLLHLSGPFYSPAQSSTPGEACPASKPPRATRLPWCRGRLRGPRLATSSSLSDSLLVDFMPTKCLMKCHCSVSLPHDTQ